MKKILILLAVLLFFAEARSEEIDLPEGQSFNYIGFLSQSWVKTTGNSIAGESSRGGGSFAKQEAGLLSSYNINDNLDIRGMVSYEKYGNQIDRTKLNYLLADFHTSGGDGNSSVGFRLGRIRLGMGSMNDTRDNPVVRDMDFAPQGLYRDQFREMATMGDGIQLYAGRVFGNGNMASAEYSIVRPVIHRADQDDVVNVLFNTPKSTGAIINSDSRIVTTGVKLALPASGVTVQYDRVEMQYTFEGNPSSPYAAEIPTGRYNTVVNYYSAKKYYMNGVDVTGEVVHVQRRGRLWEKVIGGKGYGDPYAFSVLLRYKPDEKMTYFVNYNVWFTDILDKGGVYHSSMPGNPPPDRYFYRDFNVGVKYVQGKNIIYRASVHRIKGTNTLSLDDNPSMADMKGRYNMITASVTYAF